MTQQTETRDRYTISYDKATDQVLILGKPLGKLGDESIKVQLRQFAQAGVEFSPLLTSAITYCDIRYDLCPTCHKANFKATAEANQIKMGYCLECHTSLYQKNGKLVSMYDNRSGVKIWHNKLWRS